MQLDILCLVIQSMKRYFIAILAAQSILIDELDQQEYFSHIWISTLPEQTYSMDVGHSSSVRAFF